MSRYKRGKNFSLHEYIRSFRELSKEEKPQASQQKTPETKKSEPSTKIIAPAKEDKVSIFIEVPSDHRMYTIEVKQEELEKLKENLHYEVTEDRIVFTIQDENAKYKKQIKSVSTCAYDGTNDYLQHNLGIKFHSSDREWYVNHPATESSGLPTERCFSVLQELVKPYGVGISKIYFSKGAALSPENRLWMKALGVNPQASLNRNISNEDYFNSMSGGNQEVLELLKSKESYNFEFTDVLPEGSHIVFNRMSNATFAAGGGHCSYTGPRGQKTGFEIAAAYDYLENIEYKVEPPTYPYEPVENYIIDFWECKDDSGTPLHKHKTSFSYYQHKDYSKGYGGSSNRDDRPLGYWQQKQERVKESEDWERYIGTFD